MATAAKDKLSQAVSSENLQEVKERAQVCSSCISSLRHAYVMREQENLEEAKSKLNNSLNSGSASDLREKVQVRSYDVHRNTSRCSHCCPRTRPRR